MTKPIIFGLSGTFVTDDEFNFFKETKPYGFILFKRNCETKEQLKKLTDQLRDVSGNDCPILIDQEGGRISRLKEPCFKEYPCPSSFLNEDEAFSNAKLMAKDLKDLGISINCTPLVDLCFPITHDIIGDRSFGADPIHVGKMARAVIMGHIDVGLTPVIKHLPGHGRALSDSHLDLPIVDEEPKILEETDFKAFIEALKDVNQHKIWGMTAHILYKKIDPDYCATQSPTIIKEIIKDKIGFKGLLLSDCVTMEALKGDLPTRVKESLKAGCDVALHCSGILDDMKKIVASM